MNAILIGGILLWKSQLSCSSPDRHSSPFWLSMSGFVSLMNVTDKATQISISALQAWPNPVCKNQTKARDIICEDNQLGMHCSNRNWHFVRFNWYCISNGVLCLVLVYVTLWLDLDHTLVGFYITRDVHLNSECWPSCQHLRHVTHLFIKEPTVVRARHTIICTGKDYPTGNSSRRETKRHTEETMGRQYQRVDWP